MAFVQGSSNTAATATSLTVTFGAGVTGGNAVWGGVVADSNTVTITATIGGVAVNFLDTVLDNTNNNTCRTFILGNISGAPTTVVFSFDQTIDSAAICIEENGCLAASNPADVHTGQLQPTPGTGANVLTSGNVVTTVANDIIVGVTNNNGGTTVQTAGTSPNAFTLRDGTPLLLGALPMVAEDGVIKAATGSVAATFGITSNDPSTTFMIAIKPPAISGTASTLALMGVG